MDNIDLRKFGVSWSTFCVLIGHDFCPLERAIPSTCTFIFSLQITLYISWPWLVCLVCAIFCPS